jgi:glycosyltransferase involved in cell wall biosynthesis
MTTQVRTLDNLHANSRSAPAAGVKTQGATPTMLDACVAGRISVIMPCYNAAAFVAEAIDSVLAQTHPDVELIVVDDGSSDGSLDIVRRYGEAVTLLQQSRRGPYPARNAGLAVASGEFVAFLDADDLWRPDALEKLHAALVGQGAELAYCGWQNVGEGVSGEPFVPPAYEKGDAVALFLRSCPWPIHAALLKRSLVRTLGGFSERRFSAMDYDFWLRALAVTRKMVRVPEVLVTYRWHGAGQISAVKARQVLDALAVQNDFIAAHPQLVAHLPGSRLRELTEGRVLDEAFRAFWKRDLAAAHALFRHCARAGNFRLSQAPHVLSSLLPLPAFRWLVALADRGRS